MTMDMLRMDFSRTNELRVREETKDTKSKEKRPLSWKKRVSEENWKLFHELLCKELKERKRRLERSEVR